MTLPGFDPGELERRGAQWTAREIEQQPAVWQATATMLRDLAPAARTFLGPLLARRELRIILSGAGSSAFLGRCLQPLLLAALDRRVEALATTDLVAAPQRYLQRDVPTLLVSFARSGNSPESVAAVELLERGVSECYHLVITCNPAGELFRRHNGRARSLAVLLPEASHDRGFAMTSSFTSMLYAALSLFLGPSPVDVAAIGAASSAVLADATGLLRALAAQACARVVFLGSAGLSGIADEAALKLLELSDGQVAAIANSSLGFRHGPKTFLNRDTLVVVFLSNDPLTRRYDLDLARELSAEGVAGRVIALSATAADLAGLEAVQVPLPGAASEAELYFPYVVWAQRLALGRSLALGCIPDNPSRSGTVSRVVKGVTIHGMHEESP
jgi:tagatose-6-phosphate ketose/aldose isomerase